MIEQNIVAQKPPTKLIIKNTYELLVHKVPIIKKTIVNKTKHTKEFR